MDRGAWEATVYGVTKSQTLLSNFTSLRFTSGGSAVKNSPAMQETKVQSLGQENPLEKETVTHTNILA